MLRDLLLAYSVQDLVDGISPEGAAELLAAGRMIVEEPKPNFYPHRCPETGRWFVCHEGVDSNLCEVFAWREHGAQRNAEAISDALNVSIELGQRLIKEIGL